MWALSNHVMDVIVSHVASNAEKWLPQAVNGLCGTVADGRLLQRLVHAMRLASVDDRTGFMDAVKANRRRKAATWSQWSK